ncbi:MAG: GH3 auxin-responsive promoter family protein [Proteobacteria bacterium]|nr:GH3 auxin-responsive promoter family protein [Pseudomonadota bacterium]
MPRASDALGGALLGAALKLVQGRRHRSLLRAAEAPEAAQAALLKRILEANAETAFGRRHAFARLADAAEFRRAVPIRGYEDHREDIEKQERTGEKRLTLEPPVYYNRTSGTVAEPKNIPVTASGLDRLRAHQRLGAYVLAKARLVLSGKTFAVTGAAVEGHMPGGTPFGSASGLIYRSQPRWLRSRYVLPPELSEIPDYEDRYRAMAVFGLSEPEVTCVGTANSSTLVRLLSIVNRDADALLAAVAEGRGTDAGEGGAAAFRLRPRPRRAARLRAALDAAGRLTFADIWPNLRGVVTWMGGSCGVALRRLSPDLPEDCAIVELGYVASELRGTLNVDAQRNLCLPALQDAFFEFAEREAWESGGTEVLSLDELEEGREYYLFATTPDGLYRYDMNDIVRVCGHLGRTPALEFVQKGKGVTNLTGEKLCETQVLEAVTGALEQRGVRPDFFIALAERERSRYTLFLEAAGTEPVPELAAEIDARLRAANIEYDAKRASGRLEPLRLRRLGRGAGEAYRERRVADGQRDAQFKYLHLQYAHECGFDFDAFAAAG